MWIKLYRSPFFSFDIMFFSFYFPRSIVGFVDRIWHKTIHYGLQGDANVFRFRLSNGVDTFQCISINAKADELETIVSNVGLVRYLND